MAAWLSCRCQMAPGHPARWHPPHRRETAEPVVGPGDLRRGTRSLRKKLVAPAMVGAEPRDRGGAAEGRRRTRRERGGEAQGPTSGPEKGQGEKGKKGKSKGKNKSKSKGKGKEKGSKSAKGQGKDQQKGKQNTGLRPEDIQQMIQQAVNQAMSSIGSAAAYTLQPGWYQAATGIWWRWNGSTWSTAPAEDPAERESSVRSVRASPDRPEPVVLREASRPKPAEGEKKVQEKPPKESRASSSSRPVQKGIEEETYRWPFQTQGKPRSSERPPEPAQPPKDG